MKKTILNLSAGILLCGSLFVLLMQGFALPSVGAVLNFILRIVAAACAQALFCVNIRKPWLQIIPLAVTAAFSLWGGWLLLTSDSWANANFWDYFADYCTPTFGCALTYLVCRVTGLRNWKPT